MVEETVTAAVEEANDGWVGDAVRYVFFSPIIFLTVTATATEGLGNGLATVVSSADLFC